MNHFFTALEIAESNLNSLGIGANITKKQDYSEIVINAEAAADVGLLEIRRAVPAVLHIELAMIKIITGQELAMFIIRPRNSYVFE